MVAFAAAAVESILAAAVSAVAAAAAAAESAEAFKAAESTEVEVVSPELQAAKAAAITKTKSTFFIFCDFIFYDL